jgi:hypothetical protein
LLVNERAVISLDVKGHHQKDIYRPRRSQALFIIIDCLLIFSSAITKNGLQRLAKPPALDLEKVKSDKKITDEEILKILEQPVGKTSTKNKNRKKKKKPAKKAAAAADDDEEEESSDEE